MNNIFGFFILLVLICSCGSESEAEEKSGVKNDPSVADDSIHLNNSSELINAIRPDPLVWFQNEEEDSDFKTYLDSLFLACKRCDSALVMSYLNDYMITGQYGCDLYPGMDTSKVFMNKNNFWGCRKDVAVANAISQQPFSVFCELLMNSISLYGLKKYEKAEKDFYGVDRGYTTYNFKDPRMDSLFFTYELLLLVGDHIPVYKSPSENSDVLMPINSCPIITFTGVGSNEEESRDGMIWKKIELKNPKGNGVIKGYVQGKYCLYNDNSLRVYFRRINNSWKIIQLYQTPGC